MQTRQLSDHLLPEPLEQDIATQYPHGLPVSLLHVPGAPKHLAMTAQPSRAQHWRRTSQHSLPVGSECASVARHAVAALLYASS